MHDFPVCATSFPTLLICFLQPEELQCVDTSDGCGGKFEVLIVSSRYVSSVRALTRTRGMRCVTHARARVQFF